MTILNKINIDPSDITGVINALITATGSVSPSGNFWYSVH
jgi:hypothetical protein